MLTVITVNHNTSRFVGVLLRGLRKLTRHDYRVLVADTGSRARDYRRLLSLTDQHARVSVYRKTGLGLLGELGDSATLRTFPHPMLFRVMQPLAGNLAHGTALNALFGKIDTEYGIIVDSDFTFLKKHWDVELLEALRTRELELIGGTTTEADRPAGFPTVRFMLFRVDALRSSSVDFRPIKSLYLDWYPSLRRELMHSFPEYRSFLEATDPNDQNFSLDVGWHPMKLCQDHRISWSLVQARPADGPFAEFRGTETFYHVEDLVGAHYVRGAWPLAWKRRPESQFKRLLWLASGLLPLRQKRIEAGEKSRWLKVCRNLIDERARA